MKLVGFNYTRMSAERALKWQPLKKINANIQFTDMQREEAAEIKEQLLRIGFSYTIEYEPKNATILLEGIVMVAGNDTFVKESLKQWSKKKGMDPTLQDLLIQSIWRKTNLKAFQLEDELNIMPHLQLPQVKLGRKED